jgi:abequosyltransferase
MSAIRLSVCIPVYNCAEYLPAALDSILDQITDGMEVVVFDGGSTDGTQQLMQRYASFSRLRYHRAAARGGIDADMAHTVSLAVGEYCWLFSGDDVMRPGALARAEKWLQDRPDVLLCRHSICTIDMQYMFDHKVLLDDAPMNANLADSDQRLAWFRRAASTEAFFSFISGIVVRRATWERGRMHEGFERSCWAHVVRLLALASDQLHVLHVPEVWLDQRSGNDSFLHLGLVNRYRIGIEGFQRIGAYVFGAESEEAFHIRRVLRSEFTLTMFLFAKLLCYDNPKREDRALLDELFRHLHKDRSLRSLCELAIYGAAPGWALALARRIVRAARGVPQASSLPQ